MTDQDPDNLRQFYRVVFPPGQEIEACVDGLSFQIIDVSESGIKVRGHSLPFEDDKCKGEIGWSDGEKTRFHGKLHRREPGVTVLCEVVGIPFPKIIEEQRRLIREEQEGFGLKVFSPEDLRSE